MTPVVLEYDSWSVCAICFQKITEEQCETCTTCGSEYHRQHLRTWLKIKNTCPICNHQMEFSNRLAFIPSNILNHLNTNSRNRHLLRVSNKESNVNKKSRRPFAVYPTDPIAPIQLGYSKVGILGSLKLMISEIGKFPQKWKMKSRKEKFKFIVNSVFLIIIITMLITTFITAKTLMLSITFAFFMIWASVTKWLESDEVYLTKRNRRFRRSKDEFIL